MSETDNKIDRVAEMDARLRHRHALIGLLALILSLGLHLLLWNEFPALNWHFLIRSEYPERHYQPFDLQKVQPLVTEPTPLRPPRFRPENPSLTPDLSTEAATARDGVEDARLEPPDVGGTLGEVGNPAVEPSASPRREGWDPRQEILRVEDSRSAALRSAHPRPVTTPAIHRLAVAPDLTFQADREDASRIQIAGKSGGGEWDLSSLNLQRKAVRRERGGIPPVKSPPLPVLPTVETARLIDEVPERVAPRKRLEKLLTVVVRKYTPMRDPYAYAMIEIKRLNSEVLPILPKDVLIVQDSSASITEMRLHYCQEGLKKALTYLRPGDRFNLIAFRDRSERCFPAWVEVNPDTLMRAEGFISALKSLGETDIFGSLEELLKVAPQPGRPMIVLMVTDGRPTQGLTDSAQIIARFSQANAGARSLFTMGTIGSANIYLLDLLSYRNRGDTRVVTTGRWDIPDVLAQRAASAARPVLSDVRFVFSAASRIETYPVLTPNLYLDQSLILYARYPRTESKLVFQALGQAGETECDMVFEVDLAKASNWNEEIRTLWSWHKAYDLIGRHTATRDVEILNQLRALEKEYSIRIPYAAEVGHTGPVK
jgi:hypothetical protein